jgi:hypothetical protein
MPLSPQKVPAQIKVAEQTKARMRMQQNRCPPTPFHASDPYSGEDTEVAAKPPALASLVGGLLQALTGALPVPLLVVWPSADPMAPASGFSTLGSTPCLTQTSTRGCMGSMSFSLSKL